MVNDVTALRAAPEIAELVAQHGAQLCLMHMLGTPRTMQHDPRYDDVVSEVKRFLEERLRFATDHGVAEERILLDPGSASASRPSTTSSCCAGCRSWSRSVARC